MISVTQYSKSNYIGVKKKTLIDFEIEDILVVVPVENTPGGIKLEVAKVAVNVTENTQHVVLDKLVLYHYVGEHDQL